MEQLLQKNSAKRLGAAKGGIAEICKHKFFGSFDWKGLFKGSLVAPFIPTIDPLKPGLFAEVDKEDGNTNDVDTQVSLCIDDSCNLDSVNNYLCAGKQ